MTPEREPTDRTATQPAPDPLTGLADRQEFARRLSAALAHPDPAHRAVGLFAINLDGFHRLNTLYGCAFGDHRDHDLGLGKTLFEDNPPAEGDKK